MDPSLNDFDEEFTDEIRPPDEVKREQLIENAHRSDFDREMEEALYLSMQEVREEEIKNHKFEEEIINSYLEKQTKRRELFRDLLININKVARFDKDVKEIYEILEPIIEAYCLDYIQFAEVDKETRDKVFQVLSTIRVNKNTLDTLQTIIVTNL
jgi:hypothetical protein